MRPTDSGSGRRSKPVPRKRYGLGLKETKARPRTPTNRSEPMSSRRTQTAGKGQRGAGYRKAVRQAYDAKPAAERRRLAERAQKTKGRQAAAVRHVARSRRERADERIRAGRRTGEPGVTGLRERSKSRAAETTAREARIAKLLEASKPKKKKQSFGEKFLGAITFGAVGGKSGKGKLPGARVGTVNTASALSPYGPYGTSARAVAEAYRRKPVKTAVNTGRGLKDAATSAPAALVDTILHPKKAAKEIVEDHTKRHYKESFDERVNRIIEQGAVAELGDAVTVGGPVTAGVGRGVTAVVKRRGGNRHTAPRPALRKTGGEAKSQRRSPNYFKAVAQTKVDTRRARKQETEVARARADEGKAQALRAEAVRTNERAGRVAEVVPLRSGKVARAQRRGVAKIKGRAVHRLKHEQGRVATFVRRELADLSKAERRAFYYAVTGQVSATAGPKEARAQIARRRAKIEANRAEKKYTAPSGLFRRTDELRVLDDLDANAEAAFTPKLAETIERLRPLALKVGEADPALNDDQRLARRYAQQGSTLGIERQRGETAKEFRTRRRRLRQAEQRAERRVLQARVPESAARATAGIRVTAADRRILRGDEEYVAAAKSYNGAAKELRSARTEFGNAARYRNQGLYTDAQLAEATSRVTAAQRAVAAAKTDLERVRTDIFARGEKQASARARGEQGEFPLADLGRGPKGTLGNLERKRGRLAEREAALRAVREQRATLTRREGESTADYTRRVKEAADKEGLAEPLYFPSNKYDLDTEPSNADFAPGGPKVSPAVRRYKGRNFDIGTQDTNPEVFVQGLMRNVKRKYNTKLVADTLDSVALPSYGTTLKATQLKHRLAEDGVDLGTVAFWNPGLFNKRLAEHDQALDDVERRELEHGNPEEFGQARTMSALVDSLRTNIPEDLDKESGWRPVPRAAFDEIMSATKPSGRAGRSYDIFKAKQSRVLLGGLNIPWLQFQVASNAILTGLATKGEAITDVVATQRWWRKLTDEEKGEVDALLGSGAQADAAQPKLGSTANGSLVNTYRAFKKSGIFDKRIAGKGPTTRQLNPIEIMFGLDRGQNSLFRRTLMYNQIKRDAFQRMGENITRAEAAQARIQGVLRLPPEEQWRAVMRDHKAMEEHADAVADWLGDYTTYTNFERKTLARYVMFYGYLRFSLRFAFYTMPVKHPIMSAILLQMGRLQADEIRELLGGEELPWSLGKVYFDGDGRVAGIKLRPDSIDLAKANPALNAVTGLTEATQVYSPVLPPILAAATDQVLSRSLYRGNKPWRVKGERSDYFAGFEDYDLGTRARIFGDDVASIVAPYRHGKKLTQSGQQGDDSMLGSARPTPPPKGRTKSSRILRRSLLADRRFDEEQSGWQEAVGELLPLLPRPSRDPEKARESARYQRARAQEEKGKPKKKPKRYFGGSSGGSRTKTKRYFGAGG